MSEEKFSKCKEGLEKKNYKCGISGVREKKIGRKIFRGKKNQSVSWGKIKIFVVLKES